ncbi:MAG TPA: fatty acid--CoA ligase [Nocardioides sp.]|uniref:fatty acid--CoA ligase n=1 Tax=Nocardioides sp. TaxID=35761 RepID=UPI002E32F085|nr:fatty acid--CoA ligase [Nocardioides sp.]HEX3929932.1 fatty acid--CoA ligase [Nocardioides sp.]
MRSTMQDFPLTIGSILRFGRDVFGDSEVVTLGEGGNRRRRSFTEIATRAAQLANGLRGLGIDGDQRVATFMWNNAEHLEAYLAVPAMGAVLHTLNIRLFPEQVTYVANHAEDHVVMVDASLIPVLAKVLDGFETVQTVLVVGDGDHSPLESAGKQVLSYEEVLADASPSYDWPEDVDERSAAAMCYTSGTTGNPKGVVYSHRSCYLHSMAVCTENNQGLGAADRTMPIVPMFHANAWGAPYAALMCGADLIMPDRFLQAEPIVKLIADERVTISAGVPTVWNDVLQYLRKHPDSDLSSMRGIFCGGSAVPRALIENFGTEFGITVVQGWGMTETSPVASVAHPPVGVTGDRALDYRATAGRTLFGVEARIVDDSGEVQPRDGKAVGEVQVRGPWVTAAYYADDDPEKFDHGWLKTGDVGLLDPQGYITLTDRSKDVIKSGGEWISSVELEVELMAHPNVLEAAVVGVPDEKWDERPLACIVPMEGADCGPEVLREWLSDRVAKWWLPERWAVVESVPKTSVGKFDKKVLRQAYADGELDVTTLD